MLRHYVLLLGMLLGMWSPIHAQQSAESAEPFRKANAVLLYTNAAPDSVLHAMAENLRRRGFETAE